MVTVTECTTLGKGQASFSIWIMEQRFPYRGEAKTVSDAEGSTLFQNEDFQALIMKWWETSKRRTSGLLEQNGPVQKQRCRNKQRISAACIDLALEYVKSFHYVE